MPSPVTSESNRHTGYFSISESSINTLVRLIKVLKRELFLVKTINEEQRENAAMWKNKYQKIKACYADSLHEKNKLLRTIKREREACGDKIAELSESIVTLKTENQMLKQKVTQLSKEEANS